MYKEPLRQTFIYALDTHAVLFRLRFCCFLPPEPSLLFTVAIYNLHLCCVQL